MSIIFGVLEAEGRDADLRRLSDLASMTDRYAPDGNSFRTAGRVGMGYQPYHTHQRSQVDSQPAVDQHGNMLALDGRLDNHRELSNLLEMDHSASSDSSIFLAAFERWGEGCFSRLVGDWAVALWSSRDQTLYLARDHAGSRTLYLEQSNGMVRWSTYLETFVTDPKNRTWDMRYVACYLSCQPIGNLTPYAGIEAVPPAHYLVLRGNKCRSVSHWQTTASRRIQYKSDAEYEEHFLSLFRQSVGRRIGPGASVIAQLSGGIDSGSIVCMADDILRQRGETPGSLLDTVSYYDDTEPNWNERPYFTAVETQRGKAGLHIAVSLMDWSLRPSDPAQGRYLLPGTDGFSSKREVDFSYAIGDREYRSVLSGIGGDELLGGVPTPYPELAEHLASGRFGALFQRTAEWCVATRLPFVEMLGGTLGFTLSLYKRPSLAESAIPPWIRPGAKKVCRDLHQKRASSNRRPGLSPQERINAMVWPSVLETLPNLSPEFLIRYEYRYPYLDRDLVEFLFAIPREQLVRPGRRRSLMRRALKGLVPIEVLERRRKAFIVRGPLALIRDRKAAIDDIVSRSWLIDSGFVDPRLLKSALDDVNAGSNLDWWTPLARLLALELWIRSTPNELNLPARERQATGEFCSRVPEHTRSA